MRNILKKTVIATAMAATFATVPAIAADLDFTAGTDGTIVLADVIFGDGNPGVNSEETLIVAPPTTFTVSIAVADGGTNRGDITATASVATVKFTLGGSAVFGEDLSTDALVEDSNGGNEAFHVNGAAAPALWTVAQGGAIGDNTITFDINGMANGAAITSVSMQGYSVKNLTSALNPNIRPALPVVEIAVEYVESTEDEAALAASAAIASSANATAYAVGDLFEDTNSAGDIYVVLVAFTSAGTYDATAVALSVTDGDIIRFAANDNADDVNITATDDALAIFGSQPPVDLGGTPVVINQVVSGVNGGFIRINVGSSETLFTDTDSTVGPAANDDGRGDFDASDDVTTVNLGTFQLALEAVDTTDYTDAVAGQVKKENGADFDFNGADDHTLTISATEGTFQAGGTLFLATDATCATPVFSSGSITSAENVAAAVSIAVAGNTIQLTTSYNLCYTADGTSAIPEVSGITGSWTIDYFNTRYDKSEEANGTYGPLTRNGCVATAFNIPASDNTVDEAIVRLTNTSLTNAGDIRGTLYKQDGTVIGSPAADQAFNADVLIAPTLDRHATQVFWTKPGLVIDADDSTTAPSATNQRDLLSIETIFGQENNITLTPADWGAAGSRARMVMKGAFDTCEAIALLRDKATGRLTNMTATTQGNGNNDGNNAQ